MSQGGPAPDVLLGLWDMLMGLSEAAPAAAQAEKWDALNSWALLPAVFGATSFTSEALNFNTSWIPPLTAQNHKHFSLPP